MSGAGVARKKTAPAATTTVAQAVAQLFAGPDEAKAPVVLTPEIEAERAALIVHWSEHPWNWLAGKDTDGRPLIWTKDEGSDEAVRPWPAHREYLRDYIDLLHEGKISDPMLLVDKARQMTITWATILYADWECRFRKARRWLLSKSTEDEAKEILRDKPRFVHKQLPEWVREALPQKDKPASRIEYPASDSYILAVAENAADRETRGGTASGVIVDECARQFGFYDIVTAAMPMATRLIAMTTATLGNPGARYCLEIKKDAEKHGVTVAKKEGWHVRRIPRAGGGWTLLELDAEADPEKRSPEWHTNMEAKLGAKKYRQEIRRDWTIGGGDPFYPEFGAAPHLYVQPIQQLLPDTIYRGWDFGYRYPCCVWLQISPRRNRVWQLREFMPSDVPADTFGVLVLWLSGQIGEQHELVRNDPTALNWIARCKADEEFPAVPFFESTPSRPLHFIDFSGPEALVERAEVSQRTQERSTAKILLKLGIHLQIWAGAVEDRELVTRKLLKIQADGLPGLLVDPSCKVSIDGLKGGITFVKPSKLNPVPEARAKDGYYEHLDDGRGYALVNLIPIDGELPSPAAPTFAQPRKDARDAYSRRPIGEEEYEGMTLPKVG
jgi:hypothetical protein